MTLIHIIQVHLQINHNRQERRQSRARHGSNTKLQKEIQEMALNLSVAQGISVEEAAKMMRQAKGINNDPPLADHLKNVQTKALKDSMKKHTDPVIAAFLNAIENGIITDFEPEMQLAICQRCTEPGSDPHDHSIWAHLISAERRLKIDAPLFMVMWSTMFRAESNWLKSDGYDEAAMKVESKRRHFMASYGEWLMLLPIQRVHARLVAEYRRKRMILRMETTFDDVLRHFCRESNRHDPIAVTSSTGWCQMFTYGRGCHEKGGQSECKLRHGCTECYAKGRSDWQRHGDIDCQYHKSYFVENKMGAGVTIFRAMIKPGQKAKGGGGATKTRNGNKNFKTKNRSKKRNADNTEAQ